MYFVNDLFMFDRIHKDEDAHGAPVKTSLDAGNSG